MQLDGGESASRNGNPTKAAAFRVKFPPTASPPFQEAGECHCGGPMEALGALLVTKRMLHAVDR